MRGPQVRSARWLVVPLLALCALVGGSAAEACVLNNLASLSANGSLAGRNLGANVGLQFAFTRVFGAGSRIGFSENESDLRKSLTAAVLTQPFLWRWGDGTASSGHTAAHAYRRPGTYVILVYPGRPTAGDGSWAPFDRVQIQIVPPGEVWRDNLPADLIGWIAAGVVWVLRIVVAAGAVGILAGIALDRRRSAAATGLAALAPPS